MNQIKGGVALNYLNVFLTNVLGLIIAPLMIRKMGVSEYGLYTLIGALVAYLTLLDLGLHRSITRFIALYRAKEDKKSEAGFLGLVFFIYTLIALVLVVFGIWGYFNLDVLFAESLTAVELSKAQIMFAIFILNISFILPGGVFEGICYGYEKFVFPKTISVLKYVIRAAMIILLLEFGFKAIGIVVLDTVMNFLLVMVNAVYIRKKLNIRLTFSLKSINRKFVTHVFGYTFWIFIFVLIYQFRWKSGHVLLGMETDTFIVAIYAVGIMLGSYYGTFSVAISNVFLPRATQMVAADASSEELTSMMIRIGRLSAIVLSFIFSGFLLFGEQFIQLWVGIALGIEGSRTAWLIAMCIMTAFTLPLLQGFGHSILMAKSKLAFKAILDSCLLIVGLSLGMYWIGTYGALGITVGICAGWLITQCAMTIYYQKVIRLNMWYFFKGLSTGVLPVCILALGAGYAINHLPGEGWINFLIKGAGYALLFGLAMFYFGMNRSEKEMVRKLPSLVTLKSTL